MPRIISSYIFKEMALLFVITTAIFAVTSLLTRVLQLVELAVNFGAGFYIILKFLLFVIPSFLVYIIPMSFLISVLITYNRLSSDNEITAMKASGLSILKISKPVFVMAFLAYVTAILFTSYVLPWGNMSSRRLIYDVAKTKAAIGLKQRVFNDAFEGLMLYADRIMPESGEMEGIFISEHGGEKGNNIMAARAGVISSDPQSMRVTLRLFDGTIHMADEKGLYRVVMFKTYDLNLSLKGKVEDPDNSKTNRDLSIDQLNKKISDMKKQGKRPVLDIMDMHQRLTIPVSIFVFALFAVPLGIQRVRTTRFASFSTGLAVAVSYYLLSTVMESLGKRGVLGPVLAVWGSNILMGAFGVFIFYKAVNDSQVKLFVWAEEKKHAFATLIKKTFSKRLR